MRRKLKRQKLAASAAAFGAERPDLIITDNRHHYAWTQWHRNDSQTRAPRWAL